MTALHEFIDIAFEGIKKHRGRYVRNPQQVAYAHAVADTLEEGRPGQPTAVAMLEAETGTGKTLGYLIPLLGHIALTGKRGAISTFTNQLQSQIAGKGGDLQIGLALTADHLGVQLAVGTRMGIGNYINRRRVETLLDDSSGKRRRELQAMLLWLKHGGRSIHEWILEHSRLPDGIEQGDILCRPGDPDDELAAYKNDVEACREADLVILNHYSLLLYGSNRLSLGDRPISALVVDESDRIITAAEALQMQSAPVNEIIIHADNLWNLADDPIKKRAITAAKKSAESAIETLKKIREDTEQDFLVLAAGETREDIKKLAVDLERKVRKVVDMEPPKHSVDVIETLRLYGRNIEQFIETITSVSDDLKARAAVEWSPVHKHPTLRVITENAGWLFGRLFAINQDRETTPQSLLLTSATITDEPVQNAFINAAQDLGIWLNRVRLIHASRYAPEKFGRMSFVLMNDDPPPTKKDDGEFESSPQWLENVSEMIAYAANLDDNKRTLVLALSARDAANIADRLPRMGVEENRVVLHGYGHALSACIEEYKNTKGAVLISASAWEGVNLPGLVNNLVITRLPYAPLNPAIAKLATDRLLAKGLTKDYAESILFAKYLRSARKRFKQALGRGIRHKSDRVTVWIGDPRFPKPGKSGKKMAAGFQEMIPERFRKPSPKKSAYDKARIWQNGKIIEIGDAPNPWGKKT